ncbi:c-type cytochrome [Thermoleptolyngbya oregonensis NK1-22]|uniref:C-type cytochrome n=1 Tax=Thermoleptolyngbya oregonensis NK1-22 TaxID=2547457 RepID=A0AA96YS46_9CYAN|nr:c-type cytochrome [Thermoleptolyngbya oregonensis NK1-22]
MRLFLIALLSFLLVFSPSLPVHAADLKTGAAVFEVHCAGCHVNGGNIIRRGKNLKQPALEKNGYATVEAIAQIVANGKANMSAYKDKLTAEEIESVAAYVLERAAAGWKS